MTTITRSSGLRLELPPSVQIDEPTPDQATPPTTRRRPSTRPSSPVPLPAPPQEATDAVVDAFTSQDMQLVDAVPLTPVQPPRNRRRTETTSTNNVVFDLDVSANEDAVILLEQDGFYAWNLPMSVHDVPTQPQRRGVRAVPARRQVRFEIEVATSAPIRPSDTPRRGMRRGLIEDFIVGRIKAFVFKFAARVGVDAAMKYLERDIETGLMVMDGADPAAWRRVEDLRAVALPDDRAPRILLFLHGTFSSTRGSFGTLGATASGQAFLGAVRDNYDAVIGYDHVTLSVTPLDNATDLLARLERYRGQYAPIVDVVGYSRGGLVFRCLAEHLLPMTRWQGRIDRNIFVAVPNNGTRLAMSENWRVLVDLYTNLAVTATRALSLIPQAQPAAMVLREMIQGVGALVKYVVSYATDEDGVPGLAAMIPTGPFITSINQTQPNQPVGESTYYCAVTSEFEMRRLTGSGAAQEFVQRFVAALVDLNVDQLMGEANDLVVNTPSMTAIDLAVGGFIKDSLAIEAQAAIYHTNYFIQPPVIAALSRWLRLSEAPTEPELLFRTADERLIVPPAVLPQFSGPAVRLPPDMVELGTMVTPDIPAIVDSSIFVLNAARPARDAVEVLQTLNPKYFVVRRTDAGQDLSYAYSANEVRDAASRRDINMPLLDVLDMHEFQASQPRSITDSFQLDIRNGGPPSNRGIVFDGGRPVGVVPASDERMQAAAAEIAASALESVGESRTPPPSVPSWADSLRRRMAGNRGGLPLPTPPAMPPMGSAGQPMVPPEPASGGTADDDSSASTVGVEESAVAGTMPVSPSVEVPTVTCHFMAEMDNEIVTGKPSTIEVNISRDALERVVGRVSAVGSGTVSTNRKIRLQVIPKARIEIVDEDRIEIDAPEPGEPQTVYFDVRGVDPGEGEAWIVARQGQVPLVTLKLKMRVVPARQDRTIRVSAQATTTEAPALERPLHQLRIIELDRGDDKVYRFELESPELNLLNTYESRRILGDQNNYVASLYKKIEDRWLHSQNDFDDFTAELSAFGGELFDELIPPDLQAVLWKHRAKLKSIQVISTEPFIPWELVYLKQPGKPLSPKGRFLGQMGVVRWLHNAGWPPTKIRIRDGRARHVIPHYPHPEYRLPEAEQEGSFLEQQFGSTAVEPQVGAVRTLLSQKGAFDLLHFACHGGAEHDNISDAHLLMEGRIENNQYILAPLDATVIRQWSDFVSGDRNRPLVVLNACQIGRAGYKVTGIGGFADAFLANGAGGFVGTMWSVGDSPARSFTETFYSKLLKSASIADATIAAREAARKAGDATWLAYVVYAHPHARITR